MEWLFLIVTEFNNGPTLLTVALKTVPALREVVVLEPSAHNTNLAEQKDSPTLHNLVHLVHYRIREDFYKDSII